MTPVHEITVVLVPNECQLFVFNFDNTVVYTKIYLN